MVMAAALLAMAGADERQAPFAAETTARVLMIDLTGPIGPATAHFVEQAITEAETTGAQALIIRMDTPGGLSDAMRDIIRDILQSETPVITYVAPSGSRAASAGTYILYASHVAAMAPGTNVGAATPVMIGGDLPGLPQSEEDVSEDDTAGDNEDVGPENGVLPSTTGSATTDKAVNDAVAYIRSLANVHGRNADWAERAVRSAESLPAREALELGVIDLVADDLNDLLQAIDGRRVTTTVGSRPLRTAGVQVDRMEPGAISRVLSVISNPNIAFVLMLIGVYGILFEFYNPGSIGPGVIGAICLVLGLYALNQLPLSYAGAALVLLGLAFMIAEALDPSFGILGLGGVIAFVIGAALLVDTDIPEYQISWWTIAATASVTGGFFFWLVGSLIASRSRPLSSGVESMLRETATVLDWSGGRGHVHVLGERWRAHGDDTFAPGQSVEIVDVRDLELVVVPDRKKAPED